MSALTVAIVQGAADRDAVGRDPQQVVLLGASGDGEAERVLNVAFAGGDVVDYFVDPGRGAGCP